METLILFAVSYSIASASLKPIVLDPSYEHDKWGTQPQDHMFHFAAYTSSFDGDDDNNGDGDNDTWGIPEWVAYEIKRLDQDHPLANRPTWMTDDDLHDAGLAPDDSTYAVPGTNEIGEVKSNARFVRGHMCPKDTAERISADAAFNTHTIMNACPQLQWENNGIWKDLEQLCLDWADEFERIWVVCGPVFFGREPALWLGQDGEVKAAVPDAFFKIVIRTDGDDIETLAFVIPNIITRQLNDEEDLPEFLTSIRRIETLTGLDFLTNLDDDVEDAVEEEEATSIDW